ncbi:MAG: TlyA family RNA methyltransferase [Oscillospiraceae bacterium]|nr:TlyA family RNA methyltransferase [Oscillospiraceae bacterium]
MTRLDVYLASNGYCKSRSKAAEAIASGRVTVDGTPVSKASFPVEEGMVVAVTEPASAYVSRAGYKLEAALDGFALDVRGKTALDIGASTGGFTDCLLQRGAAYVYAVDVGTAQLDEQLRQDERVCCREQTNARYLRREDFDRSIDLVTVDVSFLSQKLLYPAIAEVLSAGGVLVTLIKPQFEVGPAHVGKGGIVRDPQGKLFRSLLETLTSEARKNGLQLRATLPSPLPGGDGNREYLAYFLRI